MAIVKDYYIDTTHVLIDDSAYKDKTKEELEQNWKHLCDTYLKLYQAQELKRRKEEAERNEQDTIHKKE